jgi:alpha-N-acetylglucosaminidase
MLVLDLFCESRPMWSETEAFFGKPWVWCNIQNFGCTPFMGGALPRINQNPHATRNDAKGSQLAGLGFVNEGLGDNTVVYDLMYETAWRNEPVDLDEWIRDYAHNRYGMPNEQAYRAWKILKDTVYTAPFRTRSVITLTPTLKAARDLPYSNSDLAKAWEALLKGSQNLGAVDTYQFDLVNLSRQVLSNHAAILHREVIDAYRAKDLKAFRKASNRFLRLIRDLDILAGTRNEFLLGRCLEDAKRWGTTGAERDRFEWNARRVLTLWGQGPMIDDYARKEWSGMFNGYYLKRWEWYLDELAQSLKEDKPFDNKTFQKKLRTWMTEWSDQHETYPSKPKGDSVQISKRLWTKYGQRLGT